MCVLCFGIFSCGHPLPAHFSAPQPASKRAPRPGAAVAHHHKSESVDRVKATKRARRRRRRRRQHIPRPLKLPTRIVALNIPSWWRNTYSIGIYISFIIMGVMEKIKVRRNVSSKNCDLVLVTFSPQRYVVSSRRKQIDSRHLRSPPSSKWFTNARFSPPSTHHISSPSCDKPRSSPS